MWKWDSCVCSVQFIQCVELSLIPNHTYFHTLSTHHPTPEPHIPPQINFNIAFKNVSNRPEGADAEGAGGKKRAAGADPFSRRETRSANRPNVPRRLTEEQKAAEAKWVLVV